MLEPQCLCGFQGNEGFRVGSPPAAPNLTSANPLPIHRWPGTTRRLRQIVEPARPAGVRRAVRTASLLGRSQLGCGALSLALAHSLCLQLFDPSHGFPVGSNHAALVHQPGLEAADRLAAPRVAQNSAAL